MKLSDVTNKVSNFFSSDEKPKTPYSIKIRIINSLALKALALIAAFASFNIAGGVFFVISLLWDASLIKVLYDFTEIDIQNERTHTLDTFIKALVPALVILAGMETVGIIAKSFSVCEIAKSPAV
ncbi:MAG: hypothetical protein K940chlam1_00400 [Candidatus Anoxychlamydiales bacterium]|nr:hypothetical protein [Candidatus Anoxychlamydiales bacterium]NGX36650.1 hypothetical protein [Candidatus Anoxychlamydiales bacterium]